VQVIQYSQFTLLSDVMRCNSQLSKGWCCRLLRRWSLETGALSQLSTVATGAIDSVAKVSVSVGTWKRGSAESISRSSASCLIRRFWVWRFSRSISLFSYNRLHPMPPESYLTPSLISPLLIRSGVLSRDFAGRCSELAPKSSSRNDCDPLTGVSRVIFPPTFAD
jgi:hypothetical protein